MSNKLRALREEKKMSVAEFARAVNATESAVRKWEKGQTPTLAKAKTIADFFKTSVEAIFFGKHEEKRSKNSKKRNEIPETLRRKTRKGAKPCSPQQTNYQSC